MGLKPDWRSGYRPSRTIQRRAQAAFEEGRCRIVGRRGRARRSRSGGRRKKEEEEEQARSGIAIATKGENWSDSSESGSGAARRGTGSRGIALGIGTPAHFIIFVVALYLILSGSGSESIEPPVSQSLPSAIIPPAIASSSSAAPVVPSPGSSQFRSLRINCGGGVLTDSEGHSWDADNYDGPVPWKNQSLTDMNASLSPLATYREFPDGTGRYRFGVIANAFYKIVLLFLFNTTEIAQGPVLQVSVQGLSADSIPRWKNLSGIKMTAGFLGEVPDRYVLYVSEYVLFVPENESNLSIEFSRAPLSSILPRINAINVTQVQDNRSLLQHADFKIKDDVMLLTWHRRNCGGEGFVDSNGYIWEGDTGTPDESSIAYLHDLYSPQSKSTNSTTLPVPSQWQSDMPWVDSTVWETMRVASPRTNLGYDITLDMAEKYFVVIYVAPGAPGSQPGSTVSVTVGITQLSQQQVSTTPIAITYPLARVRKMEVFDLSVRWMENTGIQPWINGFEIVKVIPLKNLTLGADVDALAEIRKATGVPAVDSDPCLTPISGQETITCGLIDPIKGPHTITGLGNIHAGPNLIRIPAGIFKLLNLEFLFLNSSYFGGLIPVEIRQLQRLRILNLMNNKLEGGIPNSLAEMNLTELRLDFNNLSGPIPVALLHPQHPLNFSYAGNPLLCNNSSSICIVYNQTNSLTDSNALSDISNSSGEGEGEAEERGLSQSTIGMISGFVLGALTAVAIGAIICVVIVRRYKVAMETAAANLKGKAPVEEEKGGTGENLLSTGNTTGSLPSPTDKKTGKAVPDLPFMVKRYSPEQIQAAMSKSTKLESEGASFYLGPLTEHEAVTIKSVRCHTQEENLLFCQEVEVLSRLHHKNLLLFVGCCNTAGQEALVFECISDGKGTLSEALHGAAAKTNPLTWPERVNICVGIAAAVSYLHTQVYPAVVHRNINSLNIFLDKKKEPKLANFSLAKAIDVDAEVAGVVTEVRGPTGYVDPEYQQSATLKTTSDIFSLGVVLLEILTGRNAFVRSAESQGFIPIASWVRPLLESNAIEEVLDPALHIAAAQEVSGALSMNVESEEIETAWMVAECAVLCCESRAMHRPTIGKVLHELERAKKNLMKSLFRSRSQTRSQT